MNELISDRGDCRTAPATPGLLISAFMMIGGKVENVNIASQDL